MQISNARVESVPLGRPFIAASVVRGFSDSDDDVERPPLGRPVIAAVRAQASNARNRSVVRGFSDSDDEVELPSRGRPVIVAASGVQISSARNNSAVRGFSDSDDEVERPRDGTTRAGACKGARYSTRRVGLISDVEEATQFQPVDIDSSKCMALLWNGGRGQMQCPRNPFAARNFVEGMILRHMDW